MKWTTVIRGPGVYVLDGTRTVAVTSAEYAPLIETSPELLESLEELSEWMRSHCNPLQDGIVVHEMLCRAVERISKAGGKVR